MRASVAVALPDLLAQLPLDVLQESLWTHLDRDGKAAFRATCTALRTCAADLITSIVCSSKEVKRPPPPKVSRR